MCCGLSEKRYLKVAAIPTKNQTEVYITSLLQCVVLRQPEKFESQPSRFHADQKVPICRHVLQEPII